MSVFFFFFGYVFSKRHDYLYNDEIYEYISYQPNLLTIIILSVKPNS